MTDIKSTDGAGKTTALDALRACVQPLQQCLDDRRGGTQDCSAILTALAKVSIALQECICPKVPADKPVYVFNINCPVHGRGCQRINCKVCGTD